jgi:hypothetical protein
MQGDVLGISVSYEAILSTKGRELQWENYWVSAPVAAETRPVAQILGDLKKRQNQLSTALDRLLSIAELQPVGVAEMPPRSHLSDPADGVLQGIQGEIWQHLRKQTDPVMDYQTPRPFQADDIQHVIGGAVSVLDVQRTLELFEQMGLIVAVTYEGVLYYRLPTQADYLEPGEQ